MKSYSLFLFLLTIAFCSNSVMGRSLEYLETFDLKDLEIIGVETGKCSWTAIKAPNKYVYYARVGNFIGKNDGRIINILEDGIRIEEVIETRQGEFEEKITFIKAKERPKVGNVTHE